MGKHCHVQRLEIPQGHPLLIARERGGVRRKLNNLILIEHLTVVTWCNEASVDSVGYLQTRLYKIWMEATTSTSYVGLQRIPLATLEHGQLSLAWKSED